MADAINEANSSTMVFGSSSEEPTDNEHLTQAKDSKQADEFSERTWKEDLTLIVEGKRLYVTSGFLVVISPVFATLLESAFKEIGDKSRELELPGKLYDDFVDFLRCIYPNIMKDVSRENVMTVLPLACEYGIEHLKKQCELFLVSTVSENTTANELCLQLNRASNYKLEELLSVCQKLALKCGLKQMEAAEKEVPLSLDIKLGLQREQLAQLNDTVRALTEKLENTTTKCSMLEEVAKSFWLGDSKASCMPDAEIGTLKHVFVPGKYFKSSRSKHLRISDKTCFFVAKAIRMENKNCISFCIEVSPLEHLYDWSCSINAKLKILNHCDKGHRYVTKELRFTESSLCNEVHCDTAFGLSRFFGFQSLSGAIHVEVYLLVDSTVHREKRKTMD